MTIDSTILYIARSGNFKPRPDMQLVAVQPVALLGELYCLGNKLLKVEHVQHCATCRQVRLFVAETGNFVATGNCRQQVDSKLLPATSSCLDGALERLLVYYVLVRFNLSEFRLP